MTVAQLKKRMDTRFNWVDSRFKRVDRRFEQVDRRFTRLERRMNARFAVVDARFDSIDKRFDQQDARFASLERGLLTLGEKLDSIARHLKEETDMQWQALHAHENRLEDLEAAERARSSVTD